MISSTEHVDSLAATAGSFQQICFAATLDMFFKQEFLIFITGTALKLRSIHSGPVLLSIDQLGIMSVALTKDLDQLTGLDASQEICDSTLFDSSMRLLSIDLRQLTADAAKLERLRERVKRLARPDLSMACVILAEPAHAENVLTCLLQMGLPMDCISKQPISTHTFPLPSFNIPVVSKAPTHSELYEIFDWACWSTYVTESCSSNPLQTLAKAQSRLDTFDTVKASAVLVLDACLIPELQLTGATVLSARVPALIPPQKTLNARRLKHFRPGKFDHTVSTADHQGFVKFKQLSFLLNRNF